MLDLDPTFRKNNKKAKKERPMYLPDVKKRLKRTAALLSGVDEVDAPVLLWPREDDDDVQHDTARRMVASA